MTDKEPDLIYERSFKPNGEIKIYKNRIYLHTKKGLFSDSKETILLKTVTAIDLDGMLKRLKIRTASGKVYEHPHAVGKTAEEIQQVILGLL